MKQVPNLRITAVLALAVSVAGCGTLFGGTTKNISVTSAPSAATITTQPGTATFTTPTTLVLERKNSYTLIARRDGYNEVQFQIRRSMRTGPLILDILFTGLIGVIVDAVTGGWYDLQPEDVSLVLERTDDSVDGPVAIEIFIGSSKDDPGSFSVEATEPVQIEVIKQ